MMNHTSKILLALAVVSIVLISSCVTETDFICPDKTVVDNPSKCNLKQDSQQETKETAGEFTEDEIKIIPSKQKELSICEQNEVYLEKTEGCYNSNDKLSIYDNGKVTTVCSYPCSLTSSEFSTVVNQVESSYSFIYNIFETNPRFETEVRVNENDPKCTAIFGWRLTRSGNQILVICPNRIESEGELVFAKTTIEHELVHSFLRGKLGCNTLNEGLAKYISEFIDMPDFFTGCKDIYSVYQSEGMTIGEVKAKGWLNTPHMNGCFFFAELDRKEIFQKGALRLLFSGIKDKQDTNCEEMKEIISSFKNPQTVNELYQTYTII